jgi:predicted Zn-dependent protease
VNQAIRKVRGLGVILAGVGISMASGCATNPATGKSQLALVSESQEIAMGRANDSAVVQEMGLVADQGLQQYIAGIGQKLAGVSERPQLEWSYKVVEDPVVNAFAVPGGFIYITRGILGYLNNEAQLASVMGHETGHVTARHTVSQISKQELAQLGLGIGMIVSPTVAQFGNVASAGLSVLFLKFSRDDETQADELGLRYMTKAGYDPRQMPGVFTMLGKVSAAEGAGKTPAWLSTHPDPGNRFADINQKIAAMNQSWQGSTVGEEVFLSHLNGLMYGPNPREGFFRQSVFLHPDLQFQIAFPQGWQTANTKQAVMAMSSQQDAMIEVTIAQGKSLEAAAQQFFSSQGLVASQPQRTRVGEFEGLIGDFTAQDQQGGQIRGRAAFAQYGNNVYRILGYGTAQGFAQQQSQIQGTIQSFARLTDRQALNEQPMRLEVVKLQQAMSLSQFNQQYPSPISVDKLALLNQVDDVNASIPAGRMLKRVVRRS